VLVFAQNIGPKYNQPTFMEDVAHWTVVQDHDPAKIRLNRAEIFDISAVSEGTMLPVVPGLEVFPLLFQPVDDWIGIFLHTCGKDN
jgi:hypothetical protein